MREGKNREIRNVLGHLGLAVNRLIRVSYGPFQLGELAQAAVEEVKTRALREQLGERIAAIAGADFSGPISEREMEEQHAPISLRHPEVRAPRSGLRPARGQAPRASKGDGPPAATAKQRSRGRESPDQVRGRPFEGRLRRPPQDDGEKRGRGERPQRGRPQRQARPNRHKRPR
jgi:23S rRNA pseudouridine2605 synthase